MENFLNLSCQNYIKYLKDRKIWVKLWAKQLLQNINYNFSCRSLKTAFRPFTMNLVSYNFFVFRNEGEFSITDSSSERLFCP